MSTDVADELPLAGRCVRLEGDSPALEAARRMLQVLGAAEGSGAGGDLLGAIGLTGAAEEIVVSGATAAADWARSGAMALTGRADGPPVLAPGAPASAVDGALAVLELCRGVRSAAGVDLLGERAAIAGLRRRAPWSAGGAFRTLRARDGWVGLSLARDTDIEMLPALLCRDFRGDPWTALAGWIAGTPASEVVARADLLGIPAARVRSPEGVGRPGIRVLGGGRRRRAGGVPLLVDLSSLWAGPLCAQLLGSTGVRVIKVESIQRPDGARAGPRDFFDLLHAGHRSVALDFSTRSGRSDLMSLLRRADVVVEASRPRALRQLGIDAEQFVAEGTVWASITAYGRDVDNAMRVGFGDDVAVGAGLFAEDDEGPFPIGDALADPLAGVHAAAAVAAGLCGGRGYLLDVSMRDVAREAATAVVDEPSATVESTGSRWHVLTGGRRVEVAAPRARPLVGRAVPIGADTGTALRSPSGTCPG
ncbi:MAG TPA: CoA transferase [Jatrophihabitantaceae bacterium]|nr:CoA transferase [Jatrophihabitantaceae bacterium]